MKIDVCISTLNDGLLSVIGRLPAQTDVRYLIGLQLSPGYEPDSILKQWGDYAGERKDIRLVRLEGTGLSRSRNDLIDVSEHEIVMFADDDIDYLPDYAATIRRAYSEHPEADAITFQMASNARRKKYPEKTFRHNYFSAMGVTSFEMTARRQAIVDAGCRFDSNFGLGSPSPSGEEYIFVTDLLKKRCRVLGYPAIIVRHDHETSGPTYFRDSTHIRAKGKMFARVFGPILGQLPIVLFTIKKYPEYRGRVSIGRFFANMRGKNM